MIIKIKDQESFREGMRFANYLVGNAIDTMQNENPMFYKSFVGMADTLNDEILCARSDEAQWLDWAGDSIQFEVLEGQ